MNISFIPYSSIKYFNKPVRESDVPMVQTGLAFIPIVPDQNLNHNYCDLAKKFLETYNNSSTADLMFISQYYNLDTCSTIVTHRYQLNQSFETMGYHDFNAKLRELGVHTMSYHCLEYTAQPIGLDSILISIQGFCRINDTDYRTESVFVIKVINSDTFKICHQIINLFM